MHHKASYFFRLSQRICGVGFGRIPIMGSAIRVYSSFCIPCRISHVRARWERGAGLWDGHLEHFGRLCHVSCSLMGFTVDHSDAIMDGSCFLCQHLPSSYGGPFLGDTGFVQIMLSQRSRELGKPREVANGTLLSSQAYYWMICHRSL